MTDKKISQLTNITGANVDDANDEIAIVDTSASETKAITRAELFSSANLSGGTVDGTTIGGTTAAAGTFTDLTVDTATLTAIAETKADTAVDVFVYDTSKDSDGGAWRKRTQHTSWYNETLNTATRGSRREFPAVAVIVAEANQVTIYDGDDPALPMWMVFNAASSYAIGTGTSITSVSCLNSILFVASSSGGVFEISFIKDSSYRRFDSTSTATGPWLGSLVNRNSAIGYSYTGTDLIVNNNVNDVAMTVLDDAPTDPATGIQRVTIACATDGGVSVIKDDGTVVDITSSLSGGFTDYYHISFDNQNRLHFTNRSDSTYPAVFNTVPSSNVSVSTADVTYGITGSSFAPNTGIFLPASVGEIDGYLPTAAAGANGLFPLSTDFSSPPKSMQATITSTYNTGWMPGDIKLAALSDTDDTDLVYAVLNNTSDYTTEWEQTEDGWTINATSLVCDGADSNEFVYIGSSTGTNLLGVPLGDFAALEFEITSYTSGSLFADFSQGANNNIGPFNAVGTYRVVRPVGDGTTNPTIYFRSANFAGTIENIKISAADADRSVNNNGLIVNGTITRTFVDEV